MAIKWKKAYGANPLNVLLNPSLSSVESDDPVVELVKKAYGYSGDTAVIPRKVPKEYKVEKVVPSDKIKKDKVTETREFTTQEYVDFQTTYGKEVYARVEKLINSKLTEQEKVKKIKKNCIRFL